MSTGWVIDHPAHARLLAPIMRELSKPDDVIIACERQEVRAMLEHGDGHLPRRRTVWVPRPVGKGRFRKAWTRSRISKNALKWNKDVPGIPKHIQKMNISKCLKNANKKTLRLFSFTSQSCISFTGTQALLENEATCFQWSPIPPNKHIQ